MASEFDHPSGRRLLDQIRQLFQSRPVYQKKDRHIIFVCGGKIGVPSMRSRFLEWSKNELLDIIPILAEDVFNQMLRHEPPRKHNLARLEELIADISDCVIIFPESEGSFAEVGYFSRADNVCSKILVVNDQAFQTSDSFANLGPIATIDSESYLSPAVHINPKDAVINFQHVKERLERVRKRKYRKKVDYKPYGQLKRVERLVVINEIINILGAVTFEGLLDSVGLVFGVPGTPELQDLLSILSGARFIHSKDEYFVKNDDAGSFLEIDGTRIETFRGSAALYYEEYRRRNLDVLRGARH